MDVCLCFREVVCAYLLDFLPSRNPKIYKYVSAKFENVCVCAEWSCGSGSSLDFPYVYDFFLPTVRSPNLCSIIIMCGR